MGDPPPLASKRGERVWTVLELLRWTSDYFAGQGLETPRLDAEILLAHALGLGRLELYLQYEKPVNADERARYRELVRGRASERLPVSLLVGEKEFWSLRFKVTVDVLTPRPDTETLVEAALARLPDAQRRYRVLDLGTGSGAVALALAQEKPQAEITATDISPRALEVARENARELGSQEAVRFLEGHLYEPVRGERFDLIVSNPPYLARSAADSLPPELDHEPEVALFGGEDGYALLRPLAGESLAMLVSGGWIAVEVDPLQAHTFASWLSQAGLSGVQILPDLVGRDRVVVGRNEPERGAQRDPGQAPGEVSGE